MSKNISCIAIGDPHFKNKNIRTIDEFILQTQQLVEKLKPDFVVILGDILNDHERTHESCHSRATKWIQTLSKNSHVVVLIGNHDRPNNSHFLSENHFFNGLKNQENITIADNVKSMHIEKGEKSSRFVFVPYVPPGRFHDALDTLTESIEVDKPKAIFAHQEFRGAKMGAIISTIGDEWSEKNPMIISGHIHEYQKLGPNIIYVGTPYQMSYAEDANKGIYLFEFTPTGAEARRIKLNLRIKDTITMSPKEFSGFKAPENNLDLRVIISGPQADVEAVKQTAKYKQLLGVQNVKVVLRPQLEIKMSKNIITKSYLEALYDEINSDSVLKETYKTILGSIQNE